MGRCSSVVGELVQDAALAVLVVVSSASMLYLRAVVFRMLVHGTLFARVRGPGRRDCIRLYRATGDYAVTRCPSCKCGYVLHRPVYCGDYHSLHRPQDWVDRWQCAGCGAVFDTGTRELLFRGYRQIILLAGEIEQLRARVVCKHRVRRAK